MREMIHQVVPLDQLAALCPFPPRQWDDSSPQNRCFDWRSSSNEAKLICLMALFNGSACPIYDLPIDRLFIPTAYTQSSVVPVIRPSPQTLSYRLF
jgi:hypothetical protein